MKPIIWSAKEIEAAFALLRALVAQRKHHAPGTKNRRRIDAMHRHIRRELIEHGRIEPDGPYQ